MLFDINEKDNNYSNCRKNNPTFSNKINLELKRKLSFSFCYKQKKKLIKWQYFLYNLYKKYSGLESKTT